MTQNKSKYKDRPVRVAPCPTKLKLRFEKNLEKLVKNRCESRKRRKIAKRILDSNVSPTANESKVIQVPSKSDLPATDKITPVKKVRKSRFRLVRNRFINKLYESIISFLKRLFGTPYQIQHDTKRTNAPARTGFDR